MDNDGVAAKRGKRAGLDEGWRFLIALFLTPFLIYGGCGIASHTQASAAESTVKDLFPVGMPPKVELGLKSGKLAKTAADTIQALTKRVGPVRTIECDVGGAEFAGPCLVSLTFSGGKERLYFVGYFYGGVCREIEPRDDPKD
jgi:hypothetical protein